MSESRVAVLVFFDCICQTEFLYALHIQVGQSSLSTLKANTDPTKAAILIATVVRILECDVRRRQSVVTTFYISTAQAQHIPLYYRM